ncbi:FHA domain-containing protein [Mycolicibacterium rhodesiae JS60]|nr:FHA domain-containing protein [Mycolicibacterium rhodesiae JS60]
MLQLDTVLGLSMTPTTVGLVLVQGDGVDGATKGHDTFEVRRGGFSPVTTSEFVAEALSRTQAIAGGQRLQSIGVTWSDDASVEASLLLDSLADSGFDNVIPIRLPEATEAFARGIGEVIGSDVTAVCVVEPEAVVTLVVDAEEGAVQTAISYDLDTDQDLISWLSGILSASEWQPDGLVLLGSGGDFDAIARRLEEIQGIPVFAPAEAELALARGAALATVNSIAAFDDPLFTFPAPPVASRRESKSMRAATALLAGGVVAFVVSASVAVGLELLPTHGPRPEHRDVVNTAETPALRPDSAPEAPAPLPEAEPTFDAAPVVAMTMNMPPPEAPPADVPPAPAPEAPVEAMAPAAPPAVIAPPPVPQKPSLRTRLRERLQGINGG